MMTGLAISAVLLFAYALVVRFAGEREVLNFVDYSRVAARAALHRWAGNRLLVTALALALLCAASASLGLAASIAVVLFVATMVVMGAWLVAGSGRFTDCQRLAGIAEKRRK